MPRRRRPTTTAASRPVSIREFARIVGCSHSAVVKAIDRGRLRGSVDGHRRIIDVDLALREWTAGATKGKAGAPADETISAAQLRVLRARAEAIELATALKRGELIPAAKAERDGFEAARVIRDALLNLPARLSAELASTTDQSVMFARLDAEIRQVLTTLADKLAPGGGR